MADLDLTQPLPDRAHDAIRAAVNQAITDLTDGFTLTDVLFDLLGPALTAIDDLTARVTALETPPTP